MAHEEALTKEWDPRIPIFFLLSCRAFESHWRGRMNDRLLKILNKALIALQLIQHIKLPCLALVASRTHPLPTTAAFGAASSARSTGRIY